MQKYCCLLVKLQWLWHLTDPGTRAPCEWFTCRRQFYQPTAASRGFHTFRTTCEMKLLMGVPYISDQHINHIASKTSLPLSILQVCARLNHAKLLKKKAVAHKQDIGATLLNLKGPTRTSSPRTEAISTSNPQIRLCTLSLKRHSITKTIQIAYVYSGILYNQSNPNSICLSTFDHYSRVKYILKSNKFI